MATDDEALEDERTIELSSVGAIFPEIVVESISKESCLASIDIDVDLSSPLRAVFSPFQPGINGRKSTEYLRSNHSGDIGVSVSEEVSSRPVPEHAPGAVVQLDHLPPIRCGICLPETYPKTSAPRIHLDFQTPWLSPGRLYELEQHVINLWEENGRDVVLYNYLDWLGQSAQTAFGLVGATEEVKLPRELETALLDFDLQAKKRKFEGQTFDCGVCLEPKKGLACHRMTDCGHVFCKACLHDFYSSCITEGDVENVKCMNPGCENERLKGSLRRKRPRTDLSLKAAELVEIEITPAMVQRYVYMKKKKELESNKNTIYCPRKWCQGAARQQAKDGESDQSDPEDGDEDQIPQDEEQRPFGERLCVCSECSFAFCSRCLNGWHGEHIACLPSRSKKELSGEELATEAYLSKHSTRCPTCGSPVQKTMGCNHMLCHLCRTHFCYLCSSYLMESNPYTHFNTPGQGCYQQLWALEGGDFEGAPPVFEAFVEDARHEVENIAAPVNYGQALHPHLAPLARNVVLGQDDDDIMIVFEVDLTESSSEEDEVAPPPAPAMQERARGRGRIRGGRGGNRGRGDARGRVRGRAR